MERNLSGRSRIRTTTLALAALTGAIVLTVLAAAATDGQAMGSRTTRHLIGRSVRGRAIYAYRRGDPYSPTVLIVGSIHGNEPAGTTVARRLLKMQPPEGVDLWIIPNLNPDGRAANTRQNARGCLLYTSPSPRDCS